MAKKIKNILSPEDIKFLIEKTRLSREKLALLIEEKRDLELLIEQVAKNTEKSELQKFHISSPLLNKLSVFKFAEGEDVDNDEKSYISDVLSLTLPTLISGIDYKKLLKAKPSEITSKYALVLSAISDNKIKIDRAKIQKGFFACQKNKIGYHTGKWIEIINKIKMAGWLIPS